MEQKCIKYIKVLTPLIILLILNFYVIKGVKSMISALGIIVVYILISVAITTKNNYLSINYLHKKRYHIAVILFVVLVLFKFHGSSIGCWDNYYQDYGENYSKTTLEGQPRAIRSDEWLVQTPMYLAQANASESFQRDNTNINPSGQDMVISYYTPVLDITIIGAPFNWGFLFLDIERAFSWFWNFKIIALFILSYEMAFILSKRSEKIALLGAMMITYSSASQWWFSTVIVNLTIFSQACIVATYYFLKTKSIKKKIFMASIFTIGGVGYILTLYPAMQVPLGYLSAILFLYLVIKNRDKIHKKDIFIFSISILIIIGIVGYFLFTAKDAIAVISNTVYPGSRMELGGNYDFKLISNYVFGWLLPFREVTFLNSSEVSGFVSLLPLVIILFFFKKKDAEDNVLIKIIFVYMLIMLAFILVGYPEILAKVTLFSYSPPNRMLIVLGLTCNYLLFMLLPRIKQEKKKASTAIMVTIITIIIIFIPHYNTVSQNYMQRSGVIVSVAIFSMLIYLIVKGDIKKLVPYGVILMLITGFTVNPIARTLAPILQKEVSKAILNINEKDPGKWMAVGSLVGGDFLYANGVETYNGVKYYPNLDMWYALDENKAYEDIYNRYQHIILNLTDESTTFKLLQPDLFEVNINIDDLNKTGIKYLTSSEKLDHFNTENKTCFKELYYNNIDNVYIYEFLQ